MAKNPTKQNKSNALARIETEVFTGKLKSTYIFFKGKFNLTKL